MEREGRRVRGRRGRGKADSCLYLCRSQIEDPTIQQHEPVFTLANLKMPHLLPRGFVHLSLDKAAVVMTPLPSLTITYSVSCCGSALLFLWEGHYGSGLVRCMCF